MRSLRLRTTGNPGKARKGQYIVAIGNHGQLQFIDEQGTVTDAGGGAPATFADLDKAATDMALERYGAVRVTPSASATFTTAVPPGGHRRTVFIRSQGNTARTITFGTGFKPAATLSTGTTGGRIFSVTFVSDGESLYETGRSGPMVVVLLEERDDPEPAPKPKAAPRKRKGA